jgi:hypothetical protein
MEMTEGLRRVAAIGSADNWLAVLVTRSGAAEPQVSVVNAGVLDHPVTGAPVVGLVARGGTAKLANLRREPRATLVFRAGWEWVAVTGAVTLAGPDDPLPGLEPDRLPGLLRDIFAAAGGQHEDLAEYDRVMAVERRTAVLVTPERFSANPAGAEHREAQ